MASSTPSSLLSEAERFRAVEEAARDKAPMKTSCLLCSWSFKGTFAQCQEKALAHRLKKHPEINPKRRRKYASALRTWRHPSMDDEHKAEIESDRRRRARLHGVEIEE